MNSFSQDIIQIGKIVFLEPLFLYIGFLSLIIILGVFYIGNKKQSVEVRFLDDLKKVGFRNNPLLSFRYILLSMIYLCFFSIFADPHFTDIKEKITKDGIDIVIALDISKSMEASDLQPSRIIAAKEVISDFVQEIESDRLGLVVFAGKPYSSIPLTYDYSLILDIISDINTDSLNQNISGLNGTAIGDALLLSSKILDIDNIDESIQREKIIILLTDGDANQGVDPLLATKSVAGKDIKVYTIGIGSKEGGFIEINNGPFIDRQRIPPLNETTLKEIARLSKAGFYRATNNNSLEEIFNEISKLETTEIETEIEKNYVNAYMYFIAVLIGLLGMLLGVQYYFKI